MLLICCSGLPCHLIWAAVDTRTTKFLRWNTLSLGNDLLEVLTAMFNPLPAIALLPVALLWFGLGNGWFIYENKNQLEIAYIFAGLLTVIGIGVAMDSLFRLVERRTVNRWGMKF